ncbi:hypothetical protein [Psychrobacter sp. WY6]|nr:hypothetical protein [Psychrobacter sp. WY6]
MGTKKPSDATNDIGKDIHTEVSNKEVVACRILSILKAKIKNKI